MARIGEWAPFAAKLPERDSEVLACGFSCREQIEALAGRPALHIAELLAPAP